MRISSLIFQILIILVPSSLISGCDGIEPFNRDHRLDPEGSRYTPQAPAPLLAKVTAPRTVHLRWTDVNLGETGFLLERKRPSTPSTTVARLSANDTTASDMLDAWGRYTYRAIPLTNSGSGKTAQSTPTPVTGWIDGPTRTTTIPKNSRNVTKAVGLSDGKILLLSPTTSELYLPDQHSWQVIPHPRRIDRFWSSDSPVALSPLSTGGALYTIHIPSTQEDSLHHLAFDTDETSWNQIPAPRPGVGYKRAFTTLLSDGRILLAGSAWKEQDFGGPDLSTFAQIWSPTADSFRTLTPPPRKLIYSVGDLFSLPDNRALLNSTTSDVCAVFNGDDESWQLFRRCHSFGASVNHTELEDGRILAFKSGAENSWIYDPASKSWRSARLPERSYTTSALGTAPTGAALAILVYFDNYYPARFDPSTNLWHRGPAFPKPGPVADWTPTIPDRIVPLSTSEYDAIGIDLSSRSTLLYQTFPSASH